MVQRYSSIIASLTEKLIRPPEIHLVVMGVIRKRFSKLVCNVPLKTISRKWLQEKDYICFESFFCVVCIVKLAKLIVVGMGFLHTKKNMHTGIGMLNIFPNEKVN